VTAPVTRQTHPVSDSRRSDAKQSTGIACPRDGGPALASIGFVPERNNRYAYFLDGAAPVLSNRSAGVETYPAGSNGIGVDLFKGYVAIAYQQSACAGVGIPDAATWNDTAGAPQWTVFAVGNVDGDADLDHWSISTGSRSFPAAATATCMQTGPIAGGEPANDHNDV